LIIYRNTTQVNKDKVLIFDFRIFCAPGYKTVARANQCDTASYSFNTRGIFIICCEDNLYIWVGTAAIRENLAYTKTLCNALKIHVKPEVEAITIEEGKEPIDFWNLFSERLDYDKTVIPANLYSRLYHCSTSSGEFRCEEILNYCQSDLDDTDLMILDCVVCLFVWIGTGSNEEEKRLTYEIALEYIEMHPDNNRKSKIPLYCVESQKEPVEFISHFPAWDSTKSKKKPFEVPLTSLISVQVMSEQYTREYTIEELRKKPKYLDQANLEKYLSDSDFEKVFGQKRAEFYWINQGWKQIEIKKELGIY